MVRRAVLLGAGHAHLFTLKRTAEFVRRGFELVLVAPEVFWYSGLATGVLAGLYPPELDQIDVGGGATGCGIAASIQHLVAARGGQARITVLARGDSLLGDMPRGAAEKMARVLGRRGVRLALRSPVVRVDGRAVTTADGQQVP